MSAPEVDDQEAIRIGREVIAQRRREAAERAAEQRRVAAERRHEEITTWTTKRDELLARVHAGAARLLTAVRRLEQLEPCVDGTTTDPVAALREALTSGDVLDEGGQLVMHGARVDALVHDALIRPVLESRLARLTAEEDEHGS